ncbi:signal peptidase I [Erythrobacter sp. LQ02-29]|uniref:signal peptidase I n=1 Tax=Erythrobacter sp. LQ02-29 TaxID=2920384 RepID=UPI001F4E7C84|nr:signal peptidase I [Erythrobacter sp. LQ02-29]
MAGAKATAGKDESWGSFLRFCLLVILAALAFRSFVFSLFVIPSESMLPGLMDGDYLAAAKWPYGYSRHSLPLDAPLIPGRIFAHTPARGDVVIFKHPVDDTDYIKRVVALPGETVEVREGQVFIDGTPIRRERVPDVLVPMSANTDCAWGGRIVDVPAAGMACRYTAYRETMPNGRSYVTFDFGETPQDDFGPVTVPEGRLFLMGDNRDNSQDSRFPDVAGGGVGFVPLERVVGRAEALVWSTDGSARWFLPWTWFTAARWNRIGETL